MTLYWITTGRPRARSVCRFVFFNVLLLASLQAVSQVKQYVLKPGGPSFYISRSPGTYWLYSAPALNRAVDWLSHMDACDTLGLSPADYRTGLLRAGLDTLDAMDTFSKKILDQRITNTVILFLRHLHEGNLKLDYDGLQRNRDSIYVKRLLMWDTLGTVRQAVSALDCNDAKYRQLKRFLNDSVSRADTARYKAVALAMNGRRYISGNRGKEYIVVNIPKTELELFRNDSLILRMKTVVGKFTSQTPRFTSYITNIETCPFWNVPRSIAVKELLPEVQKNIGYLEQNNLEVVDGNGVVLNEDSLNWATYTKNNFPFRFRQSIGLGNALGSLKFNLKNPFSVYLHATSFQAAFDKNYRFLSHGCVRLEKPFELAGEVLRGRADLSALQCNIPGTKPNIVRIHPRIPVFVLYMPAEVVDGSMVFYKDEYRLIK